MKTLSDPRSSFLTASNRWEARARSIAASLLLLAGVSVASAASFFIDSAAGNDSNAGTSSSTPWQTLTKVNGHTFVAGDKVFFKAGGVWTGQLLLKGSGVSGNPIVVDMYGSGAKPLFQANGAKHNTVYFFNQQYWEINNLQVTNNAGSAASNLGDFRAIGIEGRDAGTLNHLYFINCLIHDVTGQVNWIGGSTANNQTGVTFQTGWDASKMTGGIVFFISTTTSVKTHFNDVLVQGCQIENCSFGGVILKQWQGTVGWGKRNSATDSNWTPHTNVTIKDNFFTQNSTAYGCDAIYVTDTQGATIENNVIAGCGTCGIEMYYADSLVVADNEIYNVTKKAGGGDANGIDPDNSTTNITVEYNYSHDNQSQGILLFQINFGSSVVRYNILQNNQSNAIWCDSAASATSSIYNNVIYSNSPNHQMITGTGGHCTFNNNIFFASPAATGTTFSSASNIVYDHNGFFGPMTRPTDAHAVTSDPRMVNPGTGGSGTVSGSAMGTLGGYKLQSGSPCINAGVSIANNGGIDFWGTPLYNGAADIGADEF